MNCFLIIREGRVLLQQSTEKENHLSLKICIGRQIYKFHNLAWSTMCKRWETPQEIKVVWSLDAPIEIELYYQANSIPKVIGEGIIDMTIFGNHFNEQIKIALTYDGIIKGWLYCQLGIEGQNSKEIDNKFLYIHKVNLFFLEDHDQRFKLQIFQNKLSIFQKEFSLIQKSKTIFPNLKKSIRYSDVISFTIIHPDKQIKPITFLVDHVKRGKTAYYQAWIRNKHNNKAGDLKFQYFLENLFLENQRKVMSRKAIFPPTLCRMSDAIVDKSSENETKPTSKKLRTLQNFSQSKHLQNLRIIEIESKKKIHDQRKPSLKLSPSHRKTDQLQVNENAMPCLRKSKSVLRSSLKIINKQKRTFYFQNPLQN